MRNKLVDKIHRIIKMDGNPSEVLLGFALKWFIAGLVVGFGLAITIFYFNGN